MTEFPLGNVVRHPAVDTGRSVMRLNSHIAGHDADAFRTL